MIPKSPDTGHATPRVAVFAGSFNPFTVGHADIVKRALGLFDKIAICIGVNRDKPEEDARQRSAEIARIYADEPRVSVDCWTGLTADYAKSVGATHLLRSVRSVKDFDYERDMADANRQVFGLETVVLFCDPALSFISSSLVRELQAYGQDVTPFLPKPNTDN